MADSIAHSLRRGRGSNRFTNREINKINKSLVSSGMLGKNQVVNLKTTPSLRTAGTGVAIGTVVVGAVAVRSKVKTKMLNRGVKKIQANRKGSRISRRGRTLRDSKGQFAGSAKGR